MNFLLVVAGPPTPAQYRQCSDGFSLLTVPGLHYYLPGYLISEHDDPEKADVVAQNWIYTLGGSSEFDKQRMLSLGHLVTLEQIEAIALWLGYYVNHMKKPSSPLGRTKLLSNGRTM